MTEQPAVPDIVAVAQRLLGDHPADCKGCPDCSILIDRNLLGEFATEIEQLRAEVERLKDRNKR